MWVAARIVRNAYWAWLGSLFLAEEQITWTNLFDPNSAGWDNPLAARYGIKAIPTCLLVDRAGKVVSADARGAELERLLAELLGNK